MPTTVADLMAPTGPVEKTLFPGEATLSVSNPEVTNLELRLEVYIQRAYSKIAGIGILQPDEAARAWALYLTFDAAYVLAVSRPAGENSQVPVIGSHTYGKDQRDGIFNRAQEYLSEYESYINAAPAEGLIDIGTRSRAVTNKFEW